MSRRGPWCVAGVRARPGTVARMGIRRHPSHRTLSLFVDEELTEARRGRVVEHIGGCSKCRHEIDFMREVQRGLREIARPRPPRDVLQHILARREAGERVILPTAWASPRRLGPAAPAITAVATALLAIAVGLLLLDSREAAAGASDMKFSPASLDLSREIDVEYRTFGALAAEPMLVLRGRYFTADDETRLGEGGTYFSTELWTEGDGTFRGSVRLPGSAVYAHAAVEDRDGEHVDHTGYRSWELMARYEDGRPKFESLWQRAQAFAGRDPREAYESIRTLTELYPDRVEGWSARYGYERGAVAATLSEELERLHRAKFDEFRRRAGAGDLSASELGELVNYAHRLPDRSARELWATVLEELHPNDPIAVRERVELLQETLKDEPRALLTEYEREWERVGPIQPLLLQNGYNAAQKAKDAAAMRRWAERLVSVQPSRARSVARDLAKLPTLRAFASGLIRAELRRLESASELHRPIHLSVSEYRLTHRRQRHDLLVTLGRLQLAEGREEAALDTLLLGAETGWDPELFVEVARLYASSGDHTKARRFYALAAVDPLTGGADLDSVLHGTGVMSGAAWAEALDAARGEQLARWQLDRPQAAERDRRPIEGVSLRTADGTSVPLHRLLGKKVTIVFLWSRWAERSAEMSRTLVEYRDRLASRGIEVLAITRDPDSAPGVTLPVYLDPHGEATAALQSSAIPDLLILDGVGHVRFDPVDAVEAVRVALTLDENG